MYIIMQIAFFFINIIYFFIKIFNPVKHKVVFISRQANKPSADFDLIEKQLKKDDSNIETVKLCKTLDGGIKNKIKYIFHMFEQMAHIASSEVVVLDSYCIVASCLHHRKDLKIIQMWHGLGLAKKFGYSIIGEKEGSSLKVAKAMHMHQQYDYAFATSEKCKKYMAEGFNVDIGKMIVAPLPKIDLLRNLDYRNQTINDIKAKHPELDGKLTVLYAPTFRKEEESQKEKIDELINKFDFEKYNLVLSLHPISKIKIDDTRVIIDRSFTSFQWGTIADKIITDYSASVYEFATLVKEIYYYIYDYNNYEDIRGMYISMDEYPGPKCVNVEQLLLAMDNTNYDLQAVKKFVDTYIDPSITNCTAHISDIIRNYPLNH